MSRYKKLIFALIVCVTLAIPTPAEAHTFIHYQWKAASCTPGIQWAYVNKTESTDWASERYHPHGWYYNSTGAYYTTAGHLQYEWAIRGWQCSSIGAPAGHKQSWIDSGRLVHRQRFQNASIQIVFSSSTESFNYTVWPIQ